MELDKRVFEIARERIATDLNTFACNAIRRAVVEVYELRGYIGDDHPIFTQYKERFRAVADGIWNMWIGEVPPFWDRCGWMEEMDADGNYVDRTEEFREMRLKVFDKILKEK